MIPKLKGISHMTNQNCFLGLPRIIVTSCDVANAIATPQVSFLPQYLVVAKSCAEDFQIIDIKIGKNSQFISPDPISAEVFSGEIILLKDKAVNTISDLPLSMKMNACPFGWSICVTVRNINPASRAFVSVVVGPPIE